MVWNLQNITQPTKECWKGRSKGRANWQPQTRAGETERRAGGREMGQKKKNKDGGIFASLTGSMLANYPSTVF